MKLTNINPPASYTISGEGKGGAMGFAKGGADVALEEVGPEETLLRYNVKAQVGGKMAQLGARLIDSTAKQMADQFFDRFAAQLAPVQVARRRPPAAGTDTEYLADGGAPAPLTQHGADGHVARRPGAAPRPAPLARLALPLRLLTSNFWACRSRSGSASARCRGHPAAALRHGLRRDDPDLGARTRAELLAAGGYVADRRSPPPSTSRCAWAGRCSSKASPAPARPRSPRCWPRSCRAGWCACNATTAWTSRPAAYEWNHARQLMAIRLAEASGEAGDRGALERGIYDRRFLQARPLLDALEGEPAVLLIDELDRADEPFEAFLLEILADFQLTHPGARHRAGPRCRRWWSSPPTARGRCMTRSAAAASTTGWTTPTRRANAPS